MKKILTRCLCAAAASVLLLTGCSSAGEPLLSYENSAITENEFTYYLSTYKARFMQSYPDFRDEPAYYAQELGQTGMTAEEFFFDAALRNVKMTLVCEAMAEEAGLSVPDAAVSAVDAYLDDFIEEYAGGSKNKFNQSLAPYGVNVSMLRDIYLRDELGGVLYAYLYGPDGTIGISDADRTAYLQENYVRVRHIYVNNAYAYVADEDGYAVTNRDGTYQTAPLEGDALEQKNAVIASIDEALAAGEDFEEVYTTYSEDQFYENGYYLSYGMNFVEEVVDAAFDLPEGDFVRVTSDVGTHYILRLPMDEAPWNEKANADFFPDYDLHVGQALYASYIESHIDAVETDEEALASFTIAEARPNYRF